MESTLLARIGRLSRKVFAIPLSFVLAAGCAPLQAYAGSMAPAVQVSDSSAGAMKTQAAQQGSAVSSLYSAYLPVLFRATNGMEEFSDCYAATDRAEWKPDYSLFDLGNDGVPELLVRTGVFGGNGLVRVYTIKSGKLVQLGSYWEWVGKTAGNSNGELFVAGWSGGKSYISSVIVENGQVICKFLKSGKSTDANPGAEIEAVNSFLADKKATWVSSSGTGDYALLSKDAKYGISHAAITVASGGTYDGTAHRPKVTVKFAGKTLVAGTDYKLTYKNNTNAGKATAVATGLGDYRGTRSAAFAIAQASLAKSAITVSSGGSYSGAAKKPSVKVTLGSKTLKSGTDYAVAYRNNVNAGTATAVISGKGNYKASRTASFKIAKASVSSAKVSVASAGAYTGSAKKPAVSVRLGSAALVAGRDFKVTYKDNVKAGVATAVLKGAGNYQGSRTASFAIGKADNPMAVMASDKSIQSSSLAKAKQSFGSVSFSGKAQGKVTYKNLSSSAVSKLFSVNASTGSITAKKGIAKGTYVLKVQVNAEGNGNYKASSQTVSFKVTVK